MSEINETEIAGVSEAQEDLLKKLQDDILAAKEERKMLTEAHNSMMSVMASLLAEKTMEKTAEKTAEKLIGFVPGQAKDGKKPTKDIRDIGLADAVRLWYKTQRAEMQNKNDFAEGIYYSEKMEDDGDS